MTSIKPHPSSIVLFTDATTDSSSSGYYIWGARMALQVHGTWDGATVNLEASLDDGTTWSTFTGYSYTADAFKVLWTTRGMMVRASIASAGASTSLSMSILLANDDR